jgi:hypothetical protein
MDFLVSFLVMMLRASYGDGINYIAGRGLIARRRP